MKKVYLIIILLFACDICYSQVTDKPIQEGYFEGYYINQSGDTISFGNRIRENLAESDVRNHLISIGGGTGYVKKPRTRVEVTVDVNSVEKPFEPTFKETTFYAWQMAKIYEKNTNARHFLISYKKDSLKESYSYLMVKAKDSLPKPLDCGECGQRKIKITFEATMYDDIILDAKELEHEYINTEKPIDTTYKVVASYIRSSNSTGMVIQTYATEDWIYNYKTADIYDPVTKKCTDWQPEWNRQSIHQAGNPQGETHNSVVYPSLWRHTTNEKKANKKCVMIGAESKTTGIIKVSEVHVNPDM